MCLAKSETGNDKTNLSIKNLSKHVTCICNDYFFINWITSDKIVEFIIVQKNQHKKARGSEQTKFCVWSEVFYCRY